MKNTSDLNQTIKSFAQHNLGCNCPEEVFNTIVIDNQTLDGFQNSVIRKYAIGNKLLIYIVSPEASGYKPEAILETLTEVGKNERDRNHYNRFRLVIVLDKYDRDSDGIFLKFNRLKQIDDQTHLHIFTKSELPELLRT